MPDDKKKPIKLNDEQLMLDASHVAEKLGDQELIDKYKNKVRIQQGAMRDYLRLHPLLHRDYARERYYYNDDAVQKLYKTIDKRSKKGGDQ